MSMLFIGREKEQQLLHQYLNSEQSEFIAVYGRRRVGKTCLIQRVIGSDYAFYVAGVNNVSMRVQLNNFMASIRQRDPNVGKVASWLEAFIALEKYLEALPSGRKIVFIDEMPWMDSPRSNFISGLEHFWNSWASWRDDIKLIVCGSATSWIINNLIKSRGGLHNRVTHKIAVKPFTLRECKQYFDARGFRLSLQQIAECYMVLGGVPFYLSKMAKAQSVAQNIDRLIFADDGELHDEFLTLYNSLYKNASGHIKIVTALALKGKGLTRQELLKLSKLSDNGKFSLMLEELENCGFVRRYVPWVSTLPRRRGISVGQSPDTLFQLIDPFTLFHFQIVNKATPGDPNFWTNSQNTHLFSSWSGLAFEMLCLNHLDQIRAALGISGITASAYSWIGKGEHRAAQIDLLIDRADHTINLCEMKYYARPYAMTAADQRAIDDKVTAFLQATSTHKALIVTLITADELIPNRYSDGIQKHLTLAQLFT